MTTTFSTDLSEVSEVEEVSVAVAEIYEKLPRDFQAQWEAIQGHDPAELANRVSRDFDNHPEERREILIAYLAQRLGFSWAFNRNETLVEKPLWLLLERETFALLSAADLEIVYLIATSSRRSRPALEPKAALAAIALWRNGDDDMHARAQEVLLNHPLPSDLDWLFELMRVLAARVTDLEVESSRRLFDLLCLQHRAGFYSLVGLALGLYFARRYGVFWRGTSRPNVTRACDEAAADYTPRMLPWLQLAAEAAVAGKMTLPWMEPLVAAAIRHEPDPAKRQIYRDFHRLRTYRITKARVAQLYAGPLRLVRSGDPHSGASLLANVDAMWDSNPARARDLLELLIAETGTTRGNRGARLTRVLNAVEDVDPLVERLLALYVITFDLRNTAVVMTRRLRGRVDWDRFGVTELDLDVYLAGADYNESLRGQMVQYGGLQIEHIDKDAAALVHYFRTKRDKVSAITNLVQNFVAPPAWLATQIGESPVVDSLFHQTMVAFERISRERDHGQHVLKLMKAEGDYQHFHEIQGASALVVLRVAQHARHKALLSAAAIGAVAGGFAPMTAGASAVFDAPVVMALTAEVCAATCWYFGIDPSEDPELPMIILAIALSGSRTDLRKPEDVHRKLHSFLIRKSMIIAALGQGSFRSVLGPTLGAGIELVSTRSGRMASRGRFLRIIKREADTEWSRRLLTGVNVYGLPLIEGITGAVLNTALMYDICESAEAVLTDRFLDRKYPDWKRSW